MSGKHFLSKKKKNVWQAFTILGNKRKIRWSEGKSIEIFWYIYIDGFILPCSNICLGHKLLFVHFYYKKKIKRIILKKINKKIKRKEKEKTNPHAPLTYLP